MITFIRITAVCVFIDLLINILIFMRLVLKDRKNPTDYQLGYEVGFRLAEELRYYSIKKKSNPAPDSSTVGGI